MLLLEWLEGVKLIVEEPNESFGYDDFFRVRVAEDVTHRQVHQATAAYYRMIQWMGAQFGRVIKKLEH